jgi:hypothetical protein
VLPSRSDVPSAAEKIGLLWGEHSGWEAPEHQAIDRSEIQADLDDQVSGQDVHCDEKELPGGPLEAREYQQARTFLVEGEEFQWLLSRRMRLESSMPSKAIMAIIRNRSNSGPSRTLVEAVSMKKRVRFEFHWDPCSFIRGQYAQAAKVSLENVVCICEDSGGAFATTCGEYVRRMWPHTGPHILSLLDEAVRSANSRYSGDSSTTRQDLHGECGSEDSAGRLMLSQPSDSVFRMLTGI